MNELEKAAKGGRYFAVGIDIESELAAKEKLLRKLEGTRDKILNQLSESQPKVADTGESKKEEPEPINPEREEKNPDKKPEVLEQPELAPQPEGEGNTQEEMSSRVNNARTVEELISVLSDFEVVSTTSGKKMETKKMIEILQDIKNNIEHSAPEDRVAKFRFMWELLQGNFTRALGIRKKAREVLLSASVEVPTINLEEESEVHREEIDKLAEENLRKLIEKFEKMFVGIKEEDLESVPGYSELSIGQKALVLENLYQIILGKIKEEALARRDKEEETARRASEDKKTGFFGLIWNGIGRSYRSATKGFRIANFEQEIALDLLKSGIDQFRDIIEKLVVGTREVGLDATFDKDGKLEVIYTFGFQPENKKEEEIVRLFNEAAHAYTNIPTEWERETASSSERKQYEDAEKRYYNARDNMFRLLERKDMSKLEIAYEMNSIDARVRMDQLFTTHPDAEAQIQKIADVKAWKRVLKDVVTERGIYFGAGFATRTITSSLLGLIGVPLAAAGIGGFIARRRAFETLKQKQAGARRGIKDTGSTAENIIDAESSKKKIDLLIKRIYREPDEAKRAKLISQLEGRIHYTEEKIYESKMNFGALEDRLKNQLDIVQAISQASTFILAHENFGDKKHRKILLQRLDALTGLHEEKINEAKKKFLKEQMIRGAIMGAGFGMAGYFVKHLANEALEGLGWHGSSTGVLDSKSGVMEPSEADIKTWGMNTTEATPVSGDDVVSVPDNFEIPLNISKVEIMEGGNIWSSAKGIAEEIGLSKTEFAEAWGKSTVELPDGRIVPISELNLVHAGDTLSYVPDEGGGIGHFVFNNESKIAFGDTLNLPGAQEAEGISSIVEQPSVEFHSSDEFSPEPLIEDTLSQSDIANQPAEVAKDGGARNWDIKSGLGLEKYVEHQNNRDLQWFFGQEYKNSEIFKTLQKTSARKFEKMLIDTSGESSALARFQEYIHDLGRKAGIDPIGGFWRKDETILEYMTRAHRILGNK